jgi:hypothetical protein
MHEDALHLSFLIKKKTDDIKHVSQYQHKRYQTLQRCCGRPHAIARASPLQRCVLHLPLGMTCRQNAHFLSLYYIPSVGPDTPLVKRYAFGHCPTSHPSGCEHPHVVIARYHLTVFCWPTCRVGYQVGVLMAST